MRLPWYLMAKGKGGGGYKTASGPIVSVNDARAAPLRSLLVNIDPVQAGSGDPSPDNVRPISGWSAVNVWRTGTNLWDEEWERGGIANATGEPVALNDRIRSKNFCRIFPSTSYYAKVPTSNAAIYWYDINKSYINNSFPYNSVINSPQNAYYFKVTLAGGVTTYNHDISINYPSTDHDYHPYSGTQYTVQLGQTVYGGTLDVTNGVLTADRAMVDLGTLTWAYKDAQYNTKPFVAHLDNALIPSSSSIIIPALCSNYLQVAPNQMNIVGKNNIYAIGLYFSANHELQILDNRYTDAATFKTAMSGVQLVYGLDTPITIPLTPTEVTTLQGQTNVLWADSGDVTIEYRVARGVDPYLMKLAVAFMGRR